MLMKWNWNVASLYIANKKAKELMKNISKKLTKKLFKNYQKSIGKSVFLKQNIVERN